MTKKRRRLNKVVQKVVEGLCILSREFPVDQAPAVGSLQKVPRREVSVREPALSATTHPAQPSHRECNVLRQLVRMSSSKRTYVLHREQADARCDHSWRFERVRKD